MSQGIISKQIIKDIADYIRLRRGVIYPILAKNMRAELDTIPTYEEGYNNGHTERTDFLMGMCNAALTELGVAKATNVLEIYDKFSEVHQKGETDGYQKGYADGETEGEKNGALQYSATATFTNLNLFGKKEIQIHMPLLREATEMFVPANEANNTVEHITLIGGDTPTLLYCNAMFNMNWRGGPLKHITLNIDFSKVTDGRYFFNNHGGIVTIDGQPLNFSSCTGNLQFNYLSNLEYIRFAPGTVKCNLAIASSSKLSDASIQSIIDGLADLTGATAQKVQFHTDVILKLTEAQTLAITAKNWTM